MNSKYILISVLVLFVLVSGILYGTTEHDSGTEFVLEQVDSNKSLEKSTSNISSFENKMDDDQKNHIGSSDALDTQEVGESLSANRTVFVHIHGAVSKEGVYELKKGSRVYQALELAGGLTADGSSKAINQARVILDGESIYFPTKDEETTMIIAAQEEAANDPRIDINKASKDELMDLPGIGDTKAGSIIAYRQLNGNFKHTEEIMGVSGIKESLFESIKGLIKVSD